MISNQETFNKEDYKDFIGETCVCCRKKIVKSWERYLIRGNYCPACDGKAAKLSRLRASLRYRKHLLIKKPEYKKYILQQIKELEEKREEIIESLPNYYRGEINLERLRL